MRVKADLLFGEQSIWLKYFGCIDLKI